MTTERELARLEVQDELGIKYEITEGLPTWESFASVEHQVLMQHVTNSVRRSKRVGASGCHGFPDVTHRFPVGSLKRPDVAIHCVLPAEVRNAVKRIPEAVVEIVSPDSRRMDYEINPPFYLKHGVADVLVFDPDTKAIDWYTKEGRRTITSPQTLTLQCGCLIDL